MLGFKSGGSTPFPHSLGGLALMLKSLVQGWINYHGRFCRSRLLYFLRRLNDHLVRPACRKYDKRLPAG